MPFFEGNWIAGLGGFYLMEINSNDSFPGTNKNNQQKRDSDIRIFLNFWVNFEPPSSTMENSLESRVRFLH